MNALRTAGLIAASPFIIVGWSVKMAYAYGRRAVLRSLFGSDAG